MQAWERSGRALSIHGNIRHGRGLAWVSARRNPGGGGALLPCIIKTAIYNTPGQAAQRAARHLAVNTDLLTLYPPTSPTWTIKCRNAPRRVRLG
jgi:hypothetical protein